MANYSQLSVGSKGSEVKTLQELLKNNGYADLAVDGDFGSKTQAAVKDYQQNNGLSVDGIVGTNTWGALTKTNTASGGSSSATETGPKYDPYQKSDTILQAEELLQQQIANKPGAYQSTWQDQLNQIISQIQNREKFSYDLNGDALYQQYKDQYTTQGKLAMMDTMGQAAAMNGGYGSSYAQSVGQQAYQGYLQQLNDKVPELYQLALNQYNQEEQNLYNQASLLAGMEDQSYSRYRDSVSDYYTELDRLTEDSRYKAEDEYSKWMDKTNLDYQIGRDEVEDAWRQKEFDEAKRQYDEQLALQKKNSVSSGGGGSTQTKTVYVQKPGLADNNTVTEYTDTGTGRLNYQGVLNALKQLKKDGTGYAEVAAYLQEALDEGFITEDHYGTLYNRYIQNSLY